VYNGDVNDRVLINSPANPVIKKARSLRQGKTRTKTGLFLVEGLHHVGSVLEAGWQVETLLYAPEMLTGDFAPVLLANARHRGLYPQAVSGKIMESLAEKDNPQGILAVVHQRCNTFEDIGEIKLGIALVSPQDPGNVGAILRTLDAVGGEALFLLDGGVECYHPTLVRASMGTLFWKPVVQSSFDTFTGWARETGVKLAGTSARAEQDYREVTFDSESWVIVMGNEQKGLSSAHLSACDLKLSIPMRGRVSSLNLAVAAGILLYNLNGKARASVPD
jgi:TrmH family RNA methyltransferase